MSWVALKAGAGDLYPRTACCDVSATGPAASLSAVGYSWLTAATVHRSGPRREVDLRLERAASLETSPSSAFEARGLARSDPNNGTWHVAWPK